jgi:SNF2 family DNA or RNA helicase
MLHDMDGKHAYGILGEPGTGKTLVATVDAVRHFEAGNLTGVIVVCPNSITSNWEDEIKLHSDVANDIYTYRSDRRNAADLWSETTGFNGLRWFLIAVESMSSRNGLDAARKFAARHRCMLIVDESTRVKTHDATRTKNVMFLARKCPYRRIATGTMLTKNLAGAWPQFEIMDPRIINMDFYPFRGYFCTMGGHHNRQVVASKNEEVFFDMASPWVSIVKKADCLNLPEKVYQKRLVAPTPEMLARYNDIMSGAVADPSFSVALVRDLRLHQLTGGFTYRIETSEGMAHLLAELEAIAAGRDFDGEAFTKMESRYVSEPLPGGNPKLEELLAISDEFPGKIIVWCRYRAEVEAIAEALRKERGAASVVEFHGGVSLDDRAVARRSFQNDPTVEFFVGQINTGGVGITLTAASVEVFYSNDWSAENRIQAEDRIHRIGQVGESCTYIDLVIGGPNTPAGGYMDSRVLRAVQAGKDYHNYVQEELLARKNIVKGSK